ncbi:hypothetical protein ISN45_Aa04g027900 [Arabidopsis thaliana x Arabidopsis arenosa]|uniref:Uncharacterized protein n=1 Tax=Arabidopsis thaliana x Arabidopsis arenosa TaxID=1240361 RepID=A0A8T2ABQ1_9BRAS|nr:hypothetical protein ISN45_Aa04g027900 [Arabidopsis thaliana x Arabidopsis arenosa]
MSERIRVLDKHVKDKISDCLETLREIHEIEIQLQQSCGIDPHITTECTCDVDLWLQRWKRTRGRDLEYYTCLLGILGKACPWMKVASRISMIPPLKLVLEYKGLPPLPPVENADPSQLQALHEEHLQDELDLLEQHLCQIRVKHRFLTNQLGSKVV